MGARSKHGPVFFNFNRFRPMVESMVESYHTKLYPNMLSFVTYTLLQTAAQTNYMKYIDVYHHFTNPYISESSIL